MNHVTREMFADAVDTAGLTDFVSHPFYDHKEGKLDECNDSTFHEDMIATD